MRIPVALARLCQKILDKHDNQNGLKSRSEAFKELVQADMELEHLKMDLFQHGLHPDDVTGKTLTAALKEMREYHAKSVAA